MRPPAINVLLVEDNLGDARLLQELLAESPDCPIRLRRVERLADGLEQARAGGIDLVLLDLSLPDSSGLETFERLNRAAPKMPIIVLSGLDDEELSLTAVREGAQDYLVKGQVDCRLLVRAVRYAIERKRIEEELARYTADLQRAILEIKQKNQQIEDELGMAREFQQALLPRKFPAFPPGVGPEQSRLRFAHRYLPSGAVGGDYYVILRLNNNLAGVLLCDVMGHGVRAALVTAMIRVLVEELRPVADEPGVFAQELNKLLHKVLRQTDTTMFVTAFYAVADARTGEVRYSTAGHPAPMWIRRDGVVVTVPAPAPGAGPVLGLFPDSAYPDASLRLEPGERLVMFTDGVFEVEGPDRVYYGQERLRAALQRLAGLPLERLLAGLVEEISGFAKTRQFNDDVCVVALERNPEGALPPPAETVESHRGKVG
jgi:serine phosphatase RsbU (regulator of sigma subunit)